MKDNRLYKIQYQSLADGQWRDSTTTGVDGHEAWLRLHRRVKAGEVDPREKGWRLMPTDLTGKAELPWGDQTQVIRDLLEYIDQFGTHTADRRVQVARQLIAGL